MMTVQVLTNCPRVRKTKQKFFRWITVGNGSQRIEMEHEVTWVQQSTTELVYRHGGKLLQTAHSFSDAHGYLTSLKTALEYAPELADHFKIGATSSLELVAVTKVVEQPLLETAETIAYNRGQRIDDREMLFAIPEDWRVEMLDDGSRNWIKLDPVMVATEITWSTKNSPNRNIELPESFRARFQPHPHFTRAAGIAA